MGKIENGKQTYSITVDLDAELYERLQSTFEDFKWRMECPSIPLNEWYRVLMAKGLDEYETSPGALLWVHMRLQMGRKQTKGRVCHLLSFLSKFIFAQSCKHL